MNNDYEVRGDVTAIFITYKGVKHETIIDTIDLELAQTLNGTWGVMWNPHTSSLYVIGQDLFLRRSGIRKTIRLHRLLTKAKTKEIVDHINHNTLDNRKSCNLRIVNNSENALNRKGLNANNTSGIRGVTWNARFKKWQVKLVINGRYTYLGYFKTLIEAAEAIKKASSEVIPYSKEGSR